MSGLAAALFFVGLLLMGADSPGPLTWTQVLANLSGLALFAVSMAMMNAQKTFPRVYPGNREGL
jgi:hypothetical protein